MKLLKKLLCFLLPVPSILVLIILGIFFRRSELDGVSISMVQFALLMLFIFVIIIIPIDMIIWGVKKYKAVHNAKSDCCNLAPELRETKETVGRSTRSISQKATLGEAKECLEDELSKLSVDNKYGNSNEHCVGLRNNRGSNVSTHSISAITASGKTITIDSSANLYSSNADEYFEEAARLIILNRCATIGMLQRTFKIGFNRAIRIMDQLEAVGVVSHEEGTKPRYALMSLEDFETFIKNNTINVAHEHEGHDNNSWKPCEQGLMEVGKQRSQKHLNFDDLEGHDFEYFCADLLRKNGFLNVEVTKSSGDHGIDVIAYKDDVKYGIQCKCYSNNIANKAVQEAYTGKSYYDCDIAVVLTNRYFTSSAKEEAVKTRVKLWDRDKLLSLIEQSLTDQ